MLRDDGIADGESESRAAPGCLRGEERLEELRQIRVADPFAVIDDLGEHGSRVVAPAGAQLDGALLAHRVHCVDEQRHEDLHELLLVRAHDGAERSR